jgi:hypothetical protein
MRLYRYLNSGGNCRQAFAFYVEHLGAKITEITTYGELSESGEVPPEWKMPPSMHGSPEELTLSLARGAAGRAGDGQILTLLVVALLTGLSLRAQVDLGVVISAACLASVLLVLERRQYYTIIQRLQQTGDVSPGRAADKGTT